MPKRNVRRQTDSKAMAQETSQMSKSRRTILSSNVEAIEKTSKSTAGLTNDVRAMSENNPCPFLRALVSSGQLNDDREPLAKVVAVVLATARAGDGAPVLPSAAIYAIGAVANGLGPLTLINTLLHGLQLSALRGGPLDKKGTGCRILNSHGAIDVKEVERLRGFAKKKTNSAGSWELGLGLPELQAYMDANFARAAGSRRLIDRALMNGEWPVLLKVMGKEGLDGRYLSLKDVVELFKNRRFPERMSKWL
jgi:hypothetical protein